MKKADTKEKTKKDVTRIASLWNNKRQEKFVVEAIMKGLSYEIQCEIENYISEDKCYEWHAEIKRVAIKMKEKVEGLIV